MICRVCHEEKEENCFQYRKRDGFETTCKECISKERKLYRTTNHERVRAWEKRYDAKRSAVQKETRRKIVLEKITSYPKHTPLIEVVNLLKWSNVGIQEVVEV